MSYLSSANGNKSSKRLMGIIYMLLGALMAIIDQLTQHKITSFDVWISIVLTGASLLGISLFEYFAKPASSTTSKDETVK
jgi:hypothetical protein